MYVGRAVPGLLKIKQILHSGKPLLSIHLHVFKEYVCNYIFSTEMANQLRIATMTCLVLFMVMQEVKPAIAANVWKKIRMLKKRVKALENKWMDKCKR